MSSWKMLQTLHVSSANETLLNDLCTNTELRRYTASFILDLIYVFVRVRVCLNIK